MNKNYSNSGAAQVVPNKCSGVLFGKKAFKPSQTPLPHPRRFPYPGPGAAGGGRGGPDPPGRGGAHRVAIGGGVRAAGVPQVSREGLSGGLGPVGESVYSMAGTVGDELVLLTKREGFFFVQKILVSPIVRPKFLTKFQLNFSNYEFHLKKSGGRTPNFSNIPLVATCFPSCFPSSWWRNHSTVRFQAQY